MNEILLENLPSGYQPFEELMLCSNLFRGVMIPIAVGDYPLLLVGKGTVPLIWLVARSGPNSSLWMYVVDASKVANPAVRVEFGDSITVTIGLTQLITVIQETPNRVNVTQLDLRPLGVNVTGNAAGLQIGSDSFSHNMLAGVRVGLQLGPPPANAPHAASAK